MRSVVISGVSSGIGRATAHELCRRGYRVFGSVLEPELAVPLRQEFGDAFIPLLLDVTDVAAVKDAAVKVKQALADGGLHGLVNNAGIAIPGPLVDLAPDVLRHHFEVNVIGAFNMVQAFLPLLRGNPDRPGRIINLSSVTGKIAYPFVGPYAASKHALEALSDSLRRELMIYGVDVVVIEPGAIDTPIWQTAARLGLSFASSDYAAILDNPGIYQTPPIALPPSTVVASIVKALGAKHPRTRYAIPDRWLLHWMLPRLLPDRWLDRILARRLGFGRIQSALKRT